MDNIITSKDNPTIKLYQKLSSSKKERLQYGLFVLEGLRIAEDALKEDSGITRLILTEKAAERWGDELLQADLRDTRTIVISNELGNRIASTESTQGVFAICRIPLRRTAESIVRENGKYLVLFGLQDPGNVGMMIRTADALGIDGVIMSGSCDLYSPKVIRSTMGSVFRMAIAVENDADALFEQLHGKGAVTSAAVIDKDAQPVTGCDFTGTQAVFIGNEGNGLPADIAQRCTRRVIIPMHGNINSLNAAMAAGILMWELKR
ncbi:RNA methyltransferase [Ruminococcus sp.]|uniref:TrmH family RNA methyltransferase n=1 Tax=Ruminococcus sp. TaxID=41978 RepID=UPI0025F24B0C|nr:RNA methyltransferase [Ruminococcus sp.]MBQ6250699.1 RNA methyltransferase [Ruminococcus sp.]